MALISAMDDFLKQILALIKSKNQYFKKIEPI